MREALNLRTLRRDVSALYRKTRQWISQRLAQAVVANEGAQIVELAVTLPVLVVLLVGVFDFGTAFNVKQRIGDSAREAARLASSQPTSDLDQNRPASVKAAVSLVLNNLTGGNVLSGNVGTCTTTGATVAHVVGSFVWQYTINGCPGTLTVTINRALVLPYTLPSGQVKAIGTQVTVSYPYRWHFSSVIKLVAPSANYAQVTPITVDAVMQNLN